MSTPAIFLDRDGTLIVERNYLSDPDQVELLPTVPESLLRLANAGYLLVVITNQSGIGRGYFTTNVLDEIHQRLFQLLDLEHVKIQHFYVCPHTPDDKCVCRKPLPYLIFQAAKELDVDLSRSWMIGDKPADVGLAPAVGKGAILVRTGYGHQFENDPAVQLFRPFIADNLAMAADKILGV
jgi:histidinol-phosphate phosphatase family protein